MDFSSPVVILALVAGGLSVVGIAKPSWPIVAVAALLLSVALLILGNKK